MTSIENEIKREVEIQIESVIYLKEITVINIILLHVDYSVIQTVVLMQVSRIPFDQSDKGKLWLQKGHRSL